MANTRYSDQFVARLRNTWASPEFQGCVARLESMRAQGGVGAPAEDSGGADAVRRLARATAIMSFMVETIYIEAGPRVRPPAGAADDARRLAGLLEALSEACGPEQEEWFAFNAACAYELARRPECAQRMAGRVSTGRRWDGGAGLQQAAAMLMQRRLDRLRSYCVPIVAEPDYEKVENMAHRLGLAAAASVLSDFAGSLLSGVAPDMDWMCEHLGDAQTLLYMSGYDVEACTAHSVRSLLGTMWAGASRGGSGRRGNALYP